MPSTIKRSIARVAPNNVAPIAKPTIAKPTIRRAVAKSTSKTLHSAITRGVANNRPWLARLKSQLREHFDNEDARTTQESTRMAHTRALAVASAVVANVGPNCDISPFFDVMALLDALLPDPLGNFPRKLQLAYAGTFHIDPAYWASPPDDTKPDPADDTESDSDHADDTESDSDHADDTDSDSEPDL